MPAAVAQSLGHSTQDRMNENRLYKTQDGSTKKASAFPCCSQTNAPAYGLGTDPNYVKM